MGSQDAKHPGNISTSNPLNAQQRLSKLVDRCAAHGLVNKLTSEERWSDLHRLADIFSPEAGWLWAVHPHKMKRLEADEYVTAVRLRLGCGGPEEPAHTHTRQMPMHVRHPSKAYKTLPLLLL